MFDDKGGEMYPKSKQILEYSKGEEWKMQCKRMHGDRGRYLVNVGEKCNLMIPWTRVQKFFIAHMVQTTHKPLFYNFFYNWYQGLFKNEH